MPRRQRDGNQLAKLVADMATGEVPSDTEERLQAPLGSTAAA